MAADARGVGRVPLLEPISHRPARGQPRVRDGRALGVDVHGQSLVTAAPLADAEAAHLGRGLVADEAVSPARALARPAALAVLIEAAVVVDKDDAGTWLRAGAVTGGAAGEAGEAGGLAHSLFIIGL